MLKGPGDFLPPDEPDFTDEQYDQFNRIDNLLEKLQSTLKNIEQYKKDFTEIHDNDRWGKITENTLDYFDEIDTYLIDEIIPSLEAYKTHMEDLGPDNDEDDYDED